MTTCYKRRRLQRGLRCLQVVAIKARHACDDGVVTCPGEKHALLSETSAGKEFHGRGWGYSVILLR